MMWRTHALIGVTSLWALAPLPDVITHDTLGPLCALAALGALLPDLDAVESKAKSLRIGQIRPLAPLSAIAFRTWGHRTLLHSPLGFLIAGICFLPVGVGWGIGPFLALWLGYGSHLLADACTKTGIPSWPNHVNRRFHLLPPRFRFTTGTHAEDMLFPILALPVLLLLLLHLTVI